MLQAYNRDRSDLVREAHNTPTGKVAPHEGRELELVSSGAKPLAVIELAKQPEQYIAAVDVADALGLRVLSRDGAEGPELVISREYRLIVRYLWLLEHGAQRLGVKQMHRELGALFGYSPADIEAFIAAEINCSCSKCRGAS